ncbi:MAG: pilus assembly protein PilM [Tepidisphaerales bacterium]
MLGIVNNLFRPAALPIGIDFGTETLRLAQVSCGAGGEYRVVAAASLDVPTTARNDPQQRLQFFVSSLKDLLASGGFRGRKAVLGLPSSALSMVHLRLPRMDEKALAKAVPFEARGKLPYDPSHAVIRYLVAGEVYHGQDPKIETIVMASPRAAVEALLNAAGKAKLDVVGMNTEPLAMLDCMLRLSRRKEDHETTVLYVDIGAGGSRAVIARGTKVLFARGIGIGGDHFTRAVAQKAGCSFEEARLLRLRTAETPQTLAGVSGAAHEAAPVASGADGPTAGREDASPDHSFALLGAAMARSRGDGTSHGARASAISSPASTGPAGDASLSVVEQAVREPLERLVEELDLCRRYHEATFPSLPVDKLMFIGGEARQKGLCAHVARELGLAACVGDPVARMARDFEFPPESGIDRRGPQPDWTVAIGLSMGSVVQTA